MQIFQCLLGLMAFIALTFSLSEDRKAVAWKKVVGGLLLGFFFCVILLRAPMVSEAFLILNRVVGVIDSVTQRASSFVFGYLAGGPAPFELKNPQHSFIIAFRVLPLILVVTVLSNILYYLRVLPFFIGLFSKLIHRFFGISGALSFGAAATVFLGTIEAPLIVKPYLRGFSRGELFALISTSMATIAGSVMVLYATTLSKVLPGALGHLMIASIMSVPVALAFSLILIPLGKSSENMAGADAVSQAVYPGFMDAVITGIQEGLTMVLQITATLIVIFALVFLTNEILGLFPGEMTIEKFLGTILRPVMWLIGIPWAETTLAGELMGVKIIFNEFVAYLQLPAAAQVLSGPSFVIMTYALCGFANFGSAGIIAGGLSAIVPERKKEIAELALRSILVGNLATLATGAMVGLVGV